jgi:hypothetical protein
MNATGTKSFKVDAALLDKYREASKETGIQIQRLVEDALRFYPLEKFAAQIAAERNRIKR